MPDLTTASARTLHGEEPFATHLNSVIIFDAQSQRCIAVNAAAIRSYGYSRAEFVGLTPEALYVPGRALALAGDGGARGTSTTAHRRKDGSEVDVDETVLDFEWDGVPVTVLFATDVTHRVHTEHELRESLSAHSRVHRLMDLGHFQVDLATGHTTWSDELFALARLPIPADSCPGPGAQSIRCHAHPDDQERILAHLRDVIATGRGQRSEYRAVRGDEAARWVEMVTVREDDAAGRPVRLVGTVVDITQRKIAHEQLEFNARHDTLTGLPNRTPLHDALSAICAGSRHSKAAVLCLDLDHFKRINDTLGHTTGDLFLQSVATRLRELMRDGDLLVRTGGDEFAIVLYDATLNDAAAAARAIIRALAEPLNVDGRTLCVSASIGAACYPDDAADVESLFRASATAMYHAKQNRRGSYRMFEESMHEAAVRRFTLETGLRYALQRDGLLVHYQPVVSIDGRLIGSEALVRWPHHQRLISAAEFVPIAEDTGLVIPLDSFVLAAACRQNVLWQGRGRELRVAVNVSAHSIVRPDFTESVRASLHDSGLDPELLELELTESAMQLDLAGTARKVAEVRALGVKVALDDFGTGYNSLSILRSCRFDTVKLDRTFVSDIETHDADSIIAEAVISASHRLGARVVAEGVETEQQRAALAELDCDHAQGYLFGAALPAAKFGTLFGEPNLLAKMGRVA
jgi:diguanylate cyclase (GGDEF)-like protein/PAS domain S-box-containing protein